MNSYGELFSGSAQNSSSRIISGFLSFRETHITGVKNEQSPIPIVWKLEQNYPNPFNPSTTIKYQVLKTGNVSLKIYDILGREVKSLLNEEKQPGTYSAIFNARNLASGVYLYRIQAGSFVDTKKLILAK